MFDRNIVDNWLHHSQGCIHKIDHFYQTHYRICLCLGSIVTRFPRIYIKTFEDAAGYDLSVLCGVCGHPLLMANVTKICMLALTRSLEYTFTPT